MGREIADLQPVVHKEFEKEGSILVVIATDAPLLPDQLKRIGQTRGYWAWPARAVSAPIRQATCLSRFQPRRRSGSGIRQQWSTLRNDELDPLLAAAPQATEEAIVNALVAATTMKGKNNNTFYALPHERLREILRKYNRLLGE